MAALAESTDDPPPAAFSRARFLQELDAAAVIRNDPAGSTAPESPTLTERGQAWRQAIAARLPDRFSPRAGWSAWAVMAAIERRTLVQMHERLAATADDDDDDDGGERHETPSAIDDDFETINRAIDGVNSAVTGNILEPAADFYLSHTSRSVQTGVANVFANLREPVTVGSSLLQGSFGDAGNSSMRFVINSTYGLLGINDQATGLGFAPVVRTLDEVLCGYGVPAGPYVVMPMFGPSSARDTAGRLATMAGQYMVLGPLVVPYRIADIAAQYAEVRDEMKFMDTMAPDSYDMRKSLYSQLQMLPCGAQTKLGRRLFAR